MGEILSSLEKCRICGDYASSALSTTAATTLEEITSTDKINFS
jgi:hypothetical protein